MKRMIFLLMFCCCKIVGAQDYQLAIIASNQNFQVYDTSDYNIKKEIDFPKVKQVLKIIPVELDCSFPGWVKIEYTTKKTTKIGWIEFKVIEKDENWNKYIEAFDLKTIEKAGCDKTALEKKGWRACNREKYQELMSAKICDCETLEFKSLKNFQSIYEIYTFMLSSECDKMNYREEAKEMFFSMLKSQRIVNIRTVMPGVISDFFSDDEVNKLLDGNPISLKQKEQVADVISLRQDSRCKIPYCVTNFWSDKRYLGFYITYKAEETGLADLAKGTLGTKKIEYSIMSLDKEHSIQLKIMEGSYSGTYIFYNAIWYFVSEKTN